MRLDQIAREAARDTQQAGRQMPIIPLENLRRRRLFLSITPLVAAGLAAWVAVLVFLLPSASPSQPSEGPTPTTVNNTPSTTTAQPVTTAPEEAPVLDADWVRGTSEQIIDDQGVVLHEFPPTILYGRNTAWDGDGGFVALTEAGLIWMRGDARQTIDVLQGSIVDIALTDTRSHVIGIISADDRSVHWIDLESGLEVEPPSAARSTDGETFTVGDRSVMIEDPDWSDVEKDETGFPIAPFELPELVVTEGGSEVLRLTVGSEERPYVEIHDFDGRRLIIGAQPHEPAVPPTTVWIIDLECGECTQRQEAPSLEYFDLIGVLPTQGEVVVPVLR